MSQDGFGFLAPAQLHSYVILDMVGHPLATCWAEDERDAKCRATDLYSPTCSVHHANDRSVEWLAAFDREARATHEENKAIARHERFKRITQRWLDAFQWINPYHNRNEQ